MINENELLNQISQTFPVVPDQTGILREGRSFVTVPYESFFGLFDFAVNEGFSHIGAITGLDEGENLSVIYHLCIPGSRHILNIKTSVLKSAPKLRTISDRFPVANLYERELVDLLGFEVEGLPPNENRYPLSDSWPPNQFPLRKDWKLESLDPKCEEVISNKTED